MDFGTVKSIIDSYFRDPFYFDHVAYKLRRLYPNMSIIDIEAELMEYHNFYRISVVTKPIDTEMDPELVENILDSYARDPYAINAVVRELERYYPYLDEKEIEAELKEYYDFYRDSLAYVQSPNKKRKRELFDTVDRPSKRHRRL